MIIEQELYPHGATALDVSRNPVKNLFSYMGSFLVHVGLGISIGTLKVQNSLDLRSDVWFSPEKIQHGTC